MRSARRKMPRIPGISVYPRGSKWAYIIYCDPDILTKQRDRIYKGGFETEEAALADAIRAKSESETRQQRGKLTDLTVRQFLVEWLESVKASVKPTTYANYADNVYAYIVPVIGHHKVKELTVPVLNAFYRELLT